MWHNAQVRHYAMPVWDLFNPSQTGIILFVPQS